MAKAKTLPPKWKKVRFGDVVKNVNETERNPIEAGLERYIGLEHIEPENLRIKQWGLIEDGTSFTKKFQKGQVLFGKRRAYQRKVAVADWDGLCSGDILTFESKNDELISELLPFIIQSEGFFEHALGTSAGSLSPRTRWSQLQDYEFPLPPRKEQERIAEILWCSEELILKQSLVIDQMNNLLECTRSHTLHGGLCKDKMKNSEIGNIPSNWECTNLIDKLSIANGQVDPRNHPYSQMILVAPDHIEVGTGRLLAKVSAKEQHAISGKYIFEANDVLYSKIRPNLKKVILSDFQGLCSADMYPLKAGDELLPSFLFEIMLSEHFTAFARSVSTRTGIPKINRKEFGLYKCAMPPLEEQKHISSVLMSIREHIQLMIKHRDASVRLKKKIIEDMLFRHS